MDCKEFSNLLDALPDGMLSDEEKRRMDEHAENCPECRGKAQMMRDLRDLGAEAEASEAFFTAWREKIREEEKMEMKSQKKKQWKGILIAAAALVFVVGGTALTRDSLPQARQSTYDNGGVYVKGSLPLSAPNTRLYALGDEANFAEMEDSWAANMIEAPRTAENAVREQKIIKSASFTLKTTDFDASLTSLQELTAAFGGRVEALNRRGDAASGENRSAEMTLRIPSDRLDEFLGSTGELGNVTNFDQEAVDVSDTYYDVKNRLITQQEKLERLRALMAKADDVSDLIEIEAAIADTQYLIDSYTADLNRYDSKADESTVNVSIREVRKTEIREVTLGERIGEGFRNSIEAGEEFLQDLIIFLVAALPWLAGIALLIFAGKCIARGLKKRKEKKKE